MLAKEISVKRYVVRLSGEERERLETLLRKGKSPAQRLLKARILLKADVSEAGEGWSDSRIIKALGTSVSMIYRVRKQLVEEGFEAVLSRKQRATPAVARIFDGEKEAKLIALACSKPPKGRARWTLRLLENKVVELGIVDRASDSTIGRTLKKTFSSPIAAAMGHPAEGQQRVRSGDGRRAGRLHAATRSRSSAGLCGRDLKATDCRNAGADPDETGRPARFDYEYERNGTANIFMMFAPLEGWRHVKVTDRHTAVDYAHVLKELADVHFANAKTIALVQDNLNIHSKASLYEAFPAAEAGGWSNASNGTTLQSTAVGSIWRSPNSASCRPNASTAASPTNKPSSTKLPLGRTTAMPTTPRPTGTSQTPNARIELQASLPFNLVNGESDD